MTDDPPYLGLKILEELEDDLRRQLAEHDRAPAAPAPDREGRWTRDADAARSRPKARGGSARLRAARGPGRRAAIMAGFLLLVGATAVAERSIDRGGDVSTRPAVLGAGHHGDERWTLSAYRNEGDVCAAFVVDQSVTSACGRALAAGAVRATSVVGPASRYVVGLAAAGVGSVAVEVGGHRVVVPARPAPADVEAGARLPRGLRWFAARLPIAEDTADAPATVGARDGAGRPLGEPYLDCSLGQASRACRALSRRKAAP